MSYEKNTSLMIHAVNEKHVLYYTISRNLNTWYEEGEVYEYGIRCVLCDSCGYRLDEEEVACVSPDFHRVCRLTGVLAKYQVYPVHLLEILDDLMNREELPAK